MTTFCAAEHCNTPTPHGGLCRPCDQKLHRHLADLPDLVDELRTTTTRQARTGKPNAQTARTETSPLPINLNASATARRIRTTLDDWSHRVADHLGEPVRYPNPVTAAHYIRTAHTAGRLNTWHDLGKLLEHLDNLTRDARRAIDIPPDRWAAGPCNAQVEQPDGTMGDCGVGLYAIVGASTVTCGRCDAQYDVAERRLWLLTNADEEQVTITVAVRALVALDANLSDTRLLHQRLRQWASRNQLVAKRHAYQDNQRYPLYRFGDIRDLLADAARRDQERDLRKNTPKKEAPTR